MLSEAGTATESREAAGVRAGDSVAAVGSMYAFSSGWATTEAPNVVPWLEDMVEMCMRIVSGDCRGVSRREICWWVCSVERCGQASVVKTNGQRVESSRDG